jgi:hypothetical protein
MEAGYKFTIIGEVTERPKVRHWKCHEKIFVHILNRPKSRAILDLNHFP